MMYMSVNGIAPSYLEEYVIFPPASRCSLQLRSADTGQLYVPRTRTILGERAFAVAGPRAWNSLPVMVRSAPSRHCLHSSPIWRHLFFFALLIRESHIDCLFTYTHIYIYFFIFILILLVLLAYISLLFSSLEATCRVHRLINWHVTYIHTYNYNVSAFTNTKPDTTHPIWYNFTRLGCSRTSCSGYWLIAVSQ